MTNRKKNKPYCAKKIDTLQFEIKKLKKCPRTKRCRELYPIEWLLNKTIKIRSARKKRYLQYYGNLTKLNTSRLILDSVGKDILTSIVNDYLDFLGTSAAVYEKNGDYALGIFSSGWCRFLDGASRKLCKTSDNAKAIKSGRWHCHESCWSKASKVSIKTGRPVDVPCKGGIRLYAIPIRADKKIIGSINFGYADPPKTRKKLQKIAKDYKVPLNKLIKYSKAYDSRPPFFINIAKKRLLVAAKLIGEIVKRKMAEKARDKAITELRDRIKELNCLYNISKLTGNLDIISIEEIAAKVPSIIRSALQYPDITCAKVILKEKEFKTSNCKPTQCNIPTNIMTAGKKIGVINIGYLKEKPEIKEKWFLNEEQKMVNIIADQLGKAVVQNEIKQKIQKAMKIKSDFISMVSHELRTPLTAIKESISIVLEEKMKKSAHEQKHFLNIAKRNVDRLSRLINDVLDFQKIESGKIKLSLQKNSINRIVRDVYQTLKPAAKEKNLNLRVNIDETLPELKFSRDMITQVLLNIIDNSIKFTEKGSIDITTAREKDNTAHVSIKDTGIGIRKKDLPKIFHHFEQIGKVGERKASGTGLGLAISKEIIKKHNGKIWVKSKFGKGTTIHFLLPIKQ